MSKPAPIPFKDLNFDAAVAAAQRVAHTHNIPTLAFPQPIGEGQPDRNTLSPAPRPRTPIKTLKVSLPLDVIEHIKQRMVADNVTQQFVLMKALQRGGIPIDDKDISEDGRRDR